MHTKKFLIQFEFDETTRWLFSDGATASTLQLIGENVATCHTTGAVPRVSVVCDEVPAAAMESEAVPC